jgi:hypothetical protein
MERTPTGDPHVVTHEPIGELAKLIRKLRWIGLEDEAQRLQRVANTLPPEERGTVSAEPSATD